jgi:hypothetical protein
VIATSSSDGKIAQAKTLGASDGVNYREHPEWHEEVLRLTGGRGVDHVVEIGGAGTLPHSIASARLGGQVHQIGVRAGSGGEIDPSGAMRKGLILRGIYVGSRQMFEAMNRAIALHEFSPVIDRVFGFEQAKGAYRKVTLLAPTLNEIDGVKVILPRIKPDWFDQIIIVDGGSTDGTVEWSRAQGYEVYIQKQRGIRHAYLEVLPLVKGDVILSLSPDGNCAPEKIPLLLDKMREGYDLVIGSRYLGTARSDDDSLVTGFGNWLFTRTVNLLYGGRNTDVMVIYRAFTRQLVFDLELDRVDACSLPERLFGTVISWEPLMSVRSVKAGKRIAEVPVGEPPRIGGTRKLQILRWGAAYYFQFWREL